MKILNVTIQMKATEQYFPVVLSIMLYKVVLTFESVDENLQCHHSNESYGAVLSFGFIHFSYFVFTKSNQCFFVPFSGSPHPVASC